MTDGGGDGDSGTRRDPPEDAGNPDESADSPDGADDSPQETGPDPEPEDEGESGSEPDDGNRGEGDDSGDPSPPEPEGGDRGGEDDTRDDDYPWADGESEGDEGGDRGENWGDAPGFDLNTGGNAALDSGGGDGGEEEDADADGDADTDGDGVYDAGQFEDDPWELPDPDAVGSDGSEDGETDTVSAMEAEPAASDGGTVAETFPGEGSVGTGSDGILSGGPEYDEEMPLSQHIEEMARRLGIVIVVMAAVSVAVLPFTDQIINFVWYSILGKAQEEVSRPNVYQPLSLVLARLKTATLAGFVVALPLFVYETYLFMRPGLYPQERRYYLAAVPTSLVLAAVGVAFAFLVVLPAIFIYFLYYSQQAAQIAFGLSDTYGLMLLLMGFFAVIFQIPVFIMLAIMMGLTDREWLAERRILFWGAFLGIALLFSPDPTGMAPVIVALTMVVLFEGTLLLLRWTDRGGRGGGEAEPG